MFGLILADDLSVSRKAMTELLDVQQIPLGGFVEGPAADFPAHLPQEDFLRACAARLMQPGQPLPMGDVYACLCKGSARPGNIIRKYTFLQLSLMPYLRVQHHITQLEGCFLVGDSLLVAPLGEDGRVDAALPPGVWTDVSTGEWISGRLRRMRGLNEMPVLARENALIPIGVNDRTAFANDADRLTLHWFQPAQEAVCTLADGTTYRTWQDETGFHAQSDSLLPWHVIVHAHGCEALL